MLDFGRYHYIWFTWLLSMWPTSHAYHWQGQIPQKGSKDYDSLLRKIR